MTATDRARFYAGEYPRSRMPLRYRAQYSDRVSVYRAFNVPSRWAVSVPEGGWIHFASFDEAIHEADRIALVRAVRAIQDGAS